VSSLLAISGCLATLAVAMAVLSAWRRRRRVSAETVRKLLHVIMGLTVVGAPWVFSSTWPMLVLAALSLAWLWAVKHCRSLRRAFGGVLHGVRGASRGEFAFVGGVLLTYLLSSGETAYYCAAIAVLALADAAAALVGRAYGRHHYRIGKTRKSLEGSATFFGVALVSTAAVLTALTSQPTALIFEAALAVATVTTLLEAGGGAGMDNLLVPVGAVVSLRLLIDPGALPYASLLLVCVGVIAVAGSNRPNMRGSHV
jgi:phytol kinase